MMKKKMMEIFDGLENTMLKQIEADLDENFNIHGLRKMSQKYNISEGIKRMEPNIAAIVKYLPVDGKISAKTFRPKKYIVGNGKIGQEPIKARRI